MKVINLGLIDYKEALNKQLELLDITHKTGKEFLIVCSHPKVITVGSAGNVEDVKFFNGEIFKIRRGGKVTLHGPGQILLYPILSLKKRDLHKHLRNLEQVAIKVLKEFKLKAYAKDTGVWVFNKKIASIGVGAKKWVTYHGMAFNLTNDFLEFELKPCGLDKSCMDGLFSFVPKVKRAYVEELLIKTLTSSLESS